MFAEFEVLSKIISLFSEHMNTKPSTNHMLKVNENIKKCKYNISTKFISKIKIIIFTYFLLYNVNLNNHGSFHVYFNIYA